MAENMTKPFSNFFPVQPAADSAALPGARRYRCIIGVFAHNEESSIIACLRSLPLSRADVHIHVLVNGSRDDTAGRACTLAADHANVTVHERAAGGKARTWNWFIHELDVGEADAFVFVDGDAVFAPGSIDALCRGLDEQPGVNAMAGMPRNGRSVSFYQNTLRTEGGLFGDLYALRGSFITAIRRGSLRLPVDLIGDDSLIAAWAATNLGRDDDWQRQRLGHAEETGFYCLPFSWLRPATWIGQYRRMISYAVRHFQNVIIKDIMVKHGAQAVPDRLATLYPEWLAQFAPRSGLVNRLIDPIALKRMREAAERAATPQ
jgi:hypothetical protein